MIDIPSALTHLPDVFTAADAAKAGLSKHVLGRGVRRGSLRRLAGGVFVAAEVWDDALAWQRHLLLVRAASHERPDAVVSHHSAAVLHDLPLPTHAPEWVAMTTNHGVTTANLGGLSRLEPGLLPDDHKASARGMPVTGIARTLCDCLRSLSLPDAFAMVDAALGRGLVTVDEIEKVRRTQFRWPGVTRVDLGLSLHDPVRETWLESTGLTDLWLHGIPLPQCQVSVFGVVGEFLGRPDAIWRKHAVALELDGRGKYLSGVAADLPVSEVASTVAAAVIAEKLREDSLRSPGLFVVRADSHEASQDIAAVARRLRDAFRTHDPRNFRGRLEVHPRARITPDNSGPEAPQYGDLLRWAPRKGGRKR